MIRQTGMSDIKFDEILLQLEKLKQGIVEGQNINHNAWLFVVNEKLIFLWTPPPSSAIDVVYMVNVDEEEWKNSLLSVPRGLSPLPHRNSISWV